MLIDLSPLLNTASKCHLGYIVGESLDFCYVFLLEQLYAFHAPLALSGRQVKSGSFPRRTLGLYTAWNWYGMWPVGCLNLDHSYNMSILQLKRLSSKVESGSRLATHFALCSFFVPHLWPSRTKHMLALCATTVHKSHILQKLWFLIFWSTRFCLAIPIMQICLMLRYYKHHKTKIQQNTIQICSICPDMLSIRKTSFLFVHVLLCYLDSSHTKQLQVFIL